MNLASAPALSLRFNSLNCNPNKASSTPNNPMRSGSFALRSNSRGIKAGGEPEYAFYNSPMIPGPLRRNEVWLALS